jgi:protoporphyrinogen oxidase
MIVIIGGGIAGLYTATKLINDNQVILIEKSNRLGGCIQTHYEKELSYETGAGRFNMHHKLLFQLIKDYGLTPIKIENTKKTYRPVLSKNKKACLKEVINGGKKISESILKRLTFLQLCNSIIGYEKADALMKAFGYNAEFQLANAYTSLRIFEEDFAEDIEYFYCKEGLSELIKRMEERLLQNGLTIYKNTNCINITPDLKIVCSNGKIIQASKIVCAVPKETLIQIPFFKEYKKLLNSVIGVNLHRIYGKYTRNWFISGERITTDLPLRQFIPLNKSKGIAMVSYSDTHDANYWLSYNTDVLLEEELKKQLKILFPKNRIPSMEWVRSYYWKNAVHVWKSGIDPIKIEKSIRKIHTNIKIVGESFSFRQGWIEGALESVLKILPL